MKKPPIKIEKFMNLLPWSEVLRLSMKNIKSANNESDISTEAFSARDIQTVIDYHEGGPDLEDWIMVGVTHDERFFYLKSGCNYDGWDQHSWGSAKLSHNMSTLYKHAIMEDEKLRFDPVKIYAYIEAEKSLSSTLESSHKDVSSNTTLHDSSSVENTPIVSHSNIHYLHKKIA